jgi:hypothetical protein
MAANELNMEKLIALCADNIPERMHCILVVLDPDDIEHAAVASSVGPEIIRTVFAMLAVSEVKEKQ